MLRVTDPSDDSCWLLDESAKGKPLACIKELTRPGSALPA